MKSLIYPNVTGFLPFYFFIILSLGKKWWWLYLKILVII